MDWHRSSDICNVVGNVYLYFSNKKHLVLRHYYYVSDIIKNLIFDALLFIQGYLDQFSQIVIDITLNKVSICNGHLSNDLYILKPIDSLLYHTASNKSIKLSSTNK